MSEGYNNNEMNAVERLAAHEALDDNLEDIHAALSKRGAIRTTLSSTPSRSNGNRISSTSIDGKSSISDASNYEEEEEDLRDRDRNRGSSNLSSDRKSGRSSRRSAEEEIEQVRSGRPSSWRSNLKDDGGERRNSNLNDDRRQRRSNRRRNARSDGSDDAGRPVTRSDSAIEKLLEYNEAGNYSVTSSDSNNNNNEKKGSMNPLLLGLSKSRDSSTLGRGGKSAHKKRKSSKSRERKSSKSRERKSSKSRERKNSKSRERKSSKSRERKSSKSRERRRHSSTGRANGTSRPRGGKQRDRDRSSSLKKTRNKDTQEDHEQRLRHRRSSSFHHIADSSGEHKNEGNDQYHITKRGTRSLRSTRSFMCEKEIQRENENKNGIHQDAFERLWGKKTTSEDLNQTNTSRQSNSSSSETDCGSASASPRASPRSLSRHKLGASPQMSPKDFYGGKSGPGTPGTTKTKKTKLEKIHELQGLCDRYKIDLDAMTDERHKCLLELNQSRGEVETLTKIVDIHDEQLTKLKSKLANVQNDLQTTWTEQQQERMELSEAAKDLARVNIEYSKSVDVARTVREKLDGIQGLLAERDKKTSVLEKELETSNENVRQLEADVLYADGQIDKLEAEVKKLESDVALYAEAADRDSLRDPSGNNDDGNGTNHLREAKNEAEKRKWEEREKEIEEQSRILKEKYRILDEDMKEFEIQRTRHLEEQQLKEREFEEKRAREAEERAREEEKVKLSDEDQRKKEEEVNKLMNELEDENTALNGRLKSEQLESTMKLRNTANTIAELQTEMARLTQDQKKRDSAPDSSPSLLVEIETLKTKVTKRNSDFEDVRMNKIELENEVEGLQNINAKIISRLSILESEIAEQKKEFENQRRKTLEWQKKTGEWSEKAVIWKQKSEHWEKKAKESNNDASSSASDEAAQAEPQALFLAAAVEKKAANISAANANGSWRLGRRIFGMSSADSEDETHVLICKLEAENYLKEAEIKTLKSEMVKMQTSYKEQAYSKIQEFEKLQKEKDAIELKNANLLKELELARKLNRAISESAAI
jgi:hypothetical protein